MSNLSELKPNACDDQKNADHVAQATAMENSDAAPRGKAPFFEHTKHWSKPKKATGIIAPFVVVATVLFGITEWIERRIDKAVEKKLTDESVLRKIAAQSRPSLTFDGNKESIITDMGAAQFIKDIQITKRTNACWPERVHIDFTRHFANAPILTAMYDTVRITPSRSKGFSWDFEI